MEFDLALQVIGNDKARPEVPEGAAMLMERRILDEVPVVIPIIIDEDHSISYRCLKSMNDSGLSIQGVNLIDFDAHGDFSSSSMINKASWLYRAVDDRLVRATNTVMLGHGYPHETRDEFGKMKEVGIQIISAEELNSGKKPEFKDLTGKFTWITVDTDCLRNWHLTGYQGIHYHTFMDLFLDSLNVGKLVGLDIVEWLTPPIGMEMLIGILAVIIGKYSQEFESWERRTH
jgi:arginase family enzyme